LGEESREEVGVHVASNLGLNFTRDHMPKINQRKIYTKINEHPSAHPLSNGNGLHAYGCHWCHINKNQEVAYGRKQQKIVCDKKITKRNSGSPYGNC